MARPHPVVCLATEFSNRSWWRSNEANVSVYLVHYHIVDVVIVERCDHGPAIRILLVGLVYQRLFPGIH